MLLGAGIGGTFGVLAGSALGAAIASRSQRDTQDQCQPEALDSSPSTPESSESELDRLKARIAELEDKKRFNERRKRTEEHSHGTTFRTSVLKPYQDAFAADPHWKADDFYFTTTKNDAVTDQEGVVCISRGSGQPPNERTVFDVTYRLSGGEWVFKSAVGREIKAGRSDKKAELLADHATIAEVVAWVRKAAK
jgi:hypothetical protein